MKEYEVMEDDWAFFFEKGMTGDKPWNYVDIYDEDETGKTLLHWCAAMGTPDMMEQLTIDPQDLVVLDHQESSLLHMAALYNNVSMVEYLLNKGLDVHQKNWIGGTPLMNACIHRKTDGDVRVAEMLLKKGAGGHGENKMGDTLFDWVFYHGNFELFLLLLKYKIKIDVPNGKRFHPLHVIVHQSSSPYGGMRWLLPLLQSGVEVNLRDCNGATPLVLALRKKDDQMMRALMDYGADVNIEVHAGVPLLLYAWQWGRIHQAELLLKHGAFPDSRDAHGDTLLSICCQKGHEKKNWVDMLLKYQANPMSVDGRGRTPLDLLLGNPEDWNSESSPNKRASEISMLIHAGARVAPFNKSGGSVLQSLVCMGQHQVIEELLRSGMDSNLLVDGVPLMHCIAEEYSGSEVFKYFIKYSGAPFIAHNGKRIIDLGEDVIPSYHMERIQRWCIEREEELLLQQVPLKKREKNRL